MALRRWRKVTKGQYERWHPWRMEVCYSDLYGEWCAWAQGEQVIPCRHPTRKAAMAACEALAIERIQWERKQHAWARALLAQDEEMIEEHGNP